MSQLLEAQFKMTRMLSKLLKFAFDNGYEITLGEAHRPGVTAKIYAQMGIGSINSLHCNRLAIDLNLFKNGVYLTDTKDYELLGIFWESIGGTWGGKFKKPDGNHFSHQFEGRK